MTIMGLMINRNDLIKKVKSDIGIDNFRVSEIQNIVEKISEIYSKKGNVILSDIFPMLDSTEISKGIVDTITKQESMEKSLMAGQADACEKVLNECIQYIRKRNNKKSLEQARKKMSHMSKSKGNEQEVDQLLAGFHKKSMTFHSLKRSG
jgi:replicative DNA helicase